MRLVFALLAIFFAVMTFKRAVIDQNEVGAIFTALGAATCLISSVLWRYQERGKGAGR